jgi:hypothetical protein
MAIIKEMKGTTTNDNGWVSGLELVATWRKCPYKGRRGSFGCSRMSIWIKESLLGIAAGRYLS